MTAGLRTKPNASRGTWVWAACLLALPAVALAHHSFAAHFLMDRFAEVEGRVVEVQWAYDFPKRRTRLKSVELRRRNLRFIPWFGTDACRLVETVSSSS